VGSNGDGLTITGTGANNNLVQGNFIGTNPAGRAAFANTGSGVNISGGAQANTVGGTTAGARNVISGNTGDGVLIGSPGTSTTSNLMQGNFIGTNAAGAAALAKTEVGVGIGFGATTNTIGGTTAGRGNLM